MPSLLARFNNNSGVHQHSLLDSYIISFSTEKNKEYHKSLLKRIYQTITFLTSVNLKCNPVGTGTMKHQVGSFYSKEDSSKFITFYLRKPNLRDNSKNDAEVAPRWYNLSRHNILPFLSFFFSCFLICQSHCQLNNSRHYSQVTDLSTEQDGFSTISLRVALNFYSKSTREVPLLWNTPGFNISVINTNKWQIPGQLTALENHTKLADRKGETI